MAPFREPKSLIEFLNRGMKHAATMQERRQYRRRLRRFRRRASDADQRRQALVRAVAADIFRNRARWSEVKGIEITDLPNQVGYLIRRLEI